jgi:hypothetical protein
MLHWQLNDVVTQSSLSKRRALSLLDRVPSNSDDALSARQQT